MIGLETSTYSQMERKGQITCDVLLRLAKALKVDATVLLLGENPCEQQNLDNNQSTTRPFENGDRYTMELTIREYNIIDIFRRLSEAKKTWACENIFNLLLKRKKKSSKE